MTANVLVGEADCASWLGGADDLHVLRNASLAGGSSGDRLNDRPLARSAALERGSTDTVPRALLAWARCASGGLRAASGGVGTVVC